MGKVRRKQPAAKNNLKSFLKNCPKTAVSVYSEEASNALSQSIHKPNLSKKLKRKIKHDSFVKKLVKVKPSKPDTLNLVQMKDTINEISFDTSGFGSIADEANTHKSNPFFNPKKVVSKKQRNNTKRKEMERFNQVINYSVFKKDPLKVVQLHLSNTIKQTNSTN